MTMRTDIEQLEASCHDFIQELDPKTKPAIAAWGLVKAGKSSLLNMLSGHIEHEFFKTGSVRTTKLNQELETERYLLVDTPGLGIDREDSRHAYKGLDSADIVLFVHAPPGELDQEEIALLEEVKETYGEDTEQRLIIVLTQLDKDQDGSSESVRQCIQEQLQKMLGIQPPCFLVSNSRYHKGAAQEKKSMMESSGIPQLISHIDALVQVIASQLESVRTSRREARKAVLLTELEKAIAVEQQQLVRQQQPYVIKVRAFNRMMAELRKRFEKRTAEISAVQNELNKL